MTDRHRATAKTALTHGKNCHTFCITSCAGDRYNMPPPLQVDLLTLKVVSESRVTWTTSVPIIVILGLSALDLGSRVRDRHADTDIRQTSDAHHPVSETTYTVSSGTLNSTIPYHTIA